MARPPAAAATVYLGGLLFLPTGFYPPPEHPGMLPIEIVGVALPAQMLVTKGWIAPVVALAGFVIRDWRSLRRWKAGWIDAALAGWIVWPLLQPLAGVASVPNAPLSSLYLAGSWGAPWLLGRLCYETETGRRDLLRAVALSGAALLPFAILEAIRPAWTYLLLYGYHPFAADGVGRYLGFRPLGLLEHGNQYGIWIALSALAAVGLTGGLRLALGAAAIASQSAGGVLSLVAGLGAMLTIRARLVRRRVVVILIGVLLGGAVLYGSGAIPFARIVGETSLGQKALGVIRASGRGSFAWRVSQDQKTLPLVKAHVIAGWGKWDWWRPADTRPWGLAMLIVGQFGLVGLLLALLTLLASPALVLWKATGRTPVGEGDVLLALIVVLAAGDAALNAFVFLPALAIAGALSNRSRQTRRHPA